MSEISVFADNDPATELLHSVDPAEIAATLAGVGVRFEQWQANAPVKAGDSDEKVMQAYADDIARLKDNEGYQTVDVISLDASGNQVAQDPEIKAKKLLELRQKFLSEHRHSEDEVRFFVDGQGLFSLHIDGKVYEILCQKGDLISVPANTPHWFDMGPAPRFVAIRFFNNPEGWVANYTGSAIADSFSRLESQ
ncbi:acireductone dioxygenase [Pseudohongiella nitratireducens]|uniref:Acireductone dioxygenase n=1 Tax=Pseudohongiella nitratireducens TaxID=1768907 RepID=A0A916VJG1_9GAMM|nr:cupin domain-containing protein [Pseudohongiella nitratireducens]MDF1622482.1 cupin domain-containing protein [Pseudohongiella nitratireducens]GFZ77497.1 acireductone dioxygenase [Pseudohongiella nitratireducens]|tara:strand:- start:1098 stop:1679 length:582 start_codon:yes stop_codon:yes gene_type:complete